MSPADLIDRTVNHVQAVLSGDGTGHDWWHVYRVWKMAQRIGQAENADLLVVELAALLHDIADWKLHEGDSTVGPARAKQWLDGLDLEPDIVDHVCRIVANISFKGAAVEQQPLSLEGQVVQDADRQGDGRRAASVHGGVFAAVLPGVEGTLSLMSCPFTTYQGKDYYLGVQYEGQSWWKNCGLLQRGSGKTALDWVERLNEREGLTEETTSEIVRSTLSNVRAGFSEDGTMLHVSVQGAFPGWDVAPTTIEMVRQFGDIPEFSTALPKPMRLRTIFQLEADLANDLRSCLASIVEAGRLPQPSDKLSDIDVVQAEDTGDTTFFVPGERENDPLDEARFTLTVDLQTAADLFEVMKEKFWY